MKNAVLAGATLVAALALPGCPIYPDEDTGCYSDYDCIPGYRCDAYSGVCYEPGSGPVGAGGTPGSPYCTGPADCGINETCTASAVCRVGDCSFPGYGCVQGYDCSVVNGMHACVLAPVGTAGSPGAGGTSGSGGIIVVAGTGGVISFGGSAGDVSSAGDSAGGVSSAGDSAGGVSSAGDSAGGVPAGGVSAAGASAGGAAGNPAAGGASQAGAGGSVASAGAPAAGAGGAPSVAGAAGAAP